MNLQAIAKRAKVSAATVSRVVNRAPTVNPQIARRVRKVIEEVGYYPNTQARALVSGRSRIFGLIVSEISNLFFAEVVQSFENIALCHNYEMLLGSTIHDPERMKFAVRRMIERRVEGVAILTFGTGESLIEEFRRHDVPLVFIDHGSPTQGVSNICINYQHGIRQAVQHLAALRHVHIAFVMGPKHRKSSLAQRAGFQKCMEEIGLEVVPEFIVMADDTIEGGKSALRKLTSLPVWPTAILCSNDMTAIGVLRQAADLAIETPQQLSTIGFDDILLAQFTMPPLTTVQTSQVDLARLAFNALLQRAERDGGTRPSDEYVLTTNLVLRQSTGLAPGSTSASRSARV